MPERRAIGELENQVMAYLWATASSATPAEVHQAVAPELAYTTVMTVLTRLWKKNRLTRERNGRPYAYRTVEPESAHRADQMRSALCNAMDSAAVLSSFVDSLEDEELIVLRQLLDEDNS